MAEQTFQEAGNKQAGESKGDSDALRNVGEQAAAAGREFKEKATEFAETSGEKLKEQASELAGAARDAASQATDRINETVSEQKGAGAEYVSNLAEAMRRASREFDSELPIAGKYIRKAASQVENVADSIRTGDLNDLVNGARDFARRQPVAFLGLATLAGFVAVRFLKSSPDSSRSSHRTSSSQKPRSPADYRGYPGPSGSDYVG